ncbi:MAG: ribbon-helix-helix protein, CopG family [Chloroflexi bacterium]|nr:ribbon-helix-helix protein, CopG family [Chloroflexota bacterium]
MRTIVELRDDQLAALDQISAEEQVSRAEAVRRAVDVYLRERKRDVLRRTFGAWGHKKLDGLEYTRAIREEWDERERGLRQRRPD